MKKIILIFATLSTFAACKNRVSDTAMESGTIGSDVAVASKEIPAQQVVVQKEVRYVYVNNDNNAAQPQKKKGWSKAAKGAVIGGGSGAVLGAVISKKKGKGAIIGGAIGAGTGYLIGRSKDKKDGRVKQ